MTFSVSGRALSRLLYSSRLDSSTDPRDPDELVASIVEASAARNAKNDITGSLLFVDGCFVQVLEGPTEAVEDTFERICKDFRHVDVRLIDLITIGERVFPDWDMACLCDSGETAAHLSEDMHEVRFLVGINARQAVEQMRRLVSDATERQQRMNMTRAAAA